MSRSTIFVAYVLSAATGQEANPPEKELKAIAKKFQARRKAEVEWRESREGLRTELIFLAIDIRKLERDLAAQGLSEAERQELSNRLCEVKSEAGNISKRLRGCGID